MTEVYGSTNALGNKGTSLSSIYQARKSGERTVNVLKKQFQDEIESRVLDDHPKNPLATENRGRGSRKVVPKTGSFVVQSSTSSKEINNDVKKLHREKSFDEARTAVQSQIERIFQKAAEAKKKQGQGSAGMVGPGGSGFTMHGVSHLTPEDVPIATPLPIHHGITLKALMEKKRQAQKLKEVVEEATPDPTESDSSTTHKVHKVQPPPTLKMPFRIHTDISESLSRHYSMDNLNVDKMIKDSNKYSSMMDLHRQNMSTSSSSTKFSQKRRNEKRKAPPKPLPKAGADEIKAKKVTEVKKSTLKAELKQSKVVRNHSKKGEQQHHHVQPEARDAELQQVLGKMSSEEQLDKFLQSVEEVNAKNEMMLNNEHEIYEQKSPERVFTKKNMRSNSNVANRWKSMDNLNGGEVVRKSGVAKPPKLSPKKNGGGATPTSSSSQRKNISESSAKSHGREINGPKSFASMSQLDELSPDKVLQFRQQKSTINSQQARKQKLKSSAQKSTSGSSSGRRASPMDISSVSHTSSSTEADGNGNRVRKSAKSSNPLSIPRQLLKSTYRARVAYLGCLPLSDQGSDLSALQMPLKDLYFKYLEVRANQDNANPTLSSSLEITETGLKINYMRDRLKGVVQEIFNPFPTIAVWAAVRFIYRREIDQDEKTRFTFAFLPLISDPGDAEKNQLFNALGKRDLKHAVSAQHPALFACIMRRAGVPRHLECHGFICDSKDDAIAIASNLYRSLMKTMKRQDNDEDSGPEYENTFNESMPTKPPRQKKRRSRGTDQSNSSSSTRRGEFKSDSSAMEVEANRNMIKRSQSEKPILDEISGQAKIRRSTSERRSADDSDASVLALRKIRRGDIYTKVAMPRSKSFMNVSGQYNLQELFRELKEKEGIESVDDILRHVISANGMSFNKTSPMYRELLMKLAMSMSGDEMFIRSRNIMMQDKIRRTNANQSPLTRLWQLLGGVKRAKSQLLQNRVNKADIGEPMPLSEETKRELAKQWTKITPFPSEVGGSNSSNSNNNREEVLLSKSRKEGKLSHGHGNRPNGSITEDGDSYMSCSECGYQSICGTSCSCSLVISTKCDHDNGSSSRPRGKLSPSNQSSKPSLKKKGLAPAPPSKVGPALSEISSSSSCITCRGTCAFCGTGNDGGTTCYSCSIYSGADSTTTDGENVHPKTTVDETSSVGSFVMDSPQTAWKLRQQELGRAPGHNLPPKKTQLLSSTSDSGSSEDEDASLHSVIQVHKKSSGSEKSGHRSIQSQRSKGSSAAEHVNGYFRNLNLVQDSAAIKPGKKMSFQDVNNTVSSRQALNEMTSSAVSMEDSLSSDSSSSSISEDSVTSGPRPAYSEANMHNSLGYLP